MPRPEFDIFGLGTIAVDDCLYVDSYPPPDQKVRINREGRNVGGQIATALAAASRLGAHCAYAAMLGEDELSTAAFEALKTAGVDCRLSSAPLAQVRFTASSSWTKKPALGIFFTT
jgi:sugar/nucleoside kinase (ribokinase family)